MRGSKRWACMLGLLFLGATAACDDGGKKADVKAEDKADKADQADKGKKADKAGSASKKSLADATDKPANDGPAEPPPPVTPGKEASPFIGKKSSAPTVAEWDAQTKEVTVHGSSARMCETKMVREWLRVSCRGEPEGYGEAQSVKVLSGGGRGDDFVFSGSAVASLIVRFVPGVDLKARFTWAKKSSTIHVYWPSGAPETAYKGKFTDG